MRATIGKQATKASNRGGIGRFTVSDYIHSHIQRHELHEKRSNFNKLLGNERAAEGIEIAEDVQPLRTPRIPYGKSC